MAPKNSGSASLRSRLLNAVLAGRITSWILLESVWWLSNGQSTGKALSDRKSARAVICVAATIPGKGDRLPASRSSGIDPLLPYALGKADFQRGVSQNSTALSHSVRLCAALGCPKYPFSIDEAGAEYWRDHTATSSGTFTENQLSQIIFLDHYLE